MNIFLDVVDSNVFSKCGLALFHSLWQLSLLAFAVKLLLVLTNERQSRIRYIGAMFGLFGCVAIPIATFFSMPVEQGTLGVVSQNDPLEKYGQKELVGNSTPESKLAGAGLGSVIAINDLPPTNGESLPSTMFDTQSMNSGLVAGLRSKVMWLSPWVAVLWLMGVCAFAVRPIIGIAHIVRLKRVGQTPVDSKIESRVQQWVIQLHIRRVVIVAQSSLVVVPTVIGFIRPVVLLPISAISGLSAPELDAILLHELAHVKRWDDLALLFQSMVETLLFYHPAVRWIAVVANRERENCCDDLSAHASGSSVPLASGLLRLAELKRNHPVVLCATGGELSARVRRLKNLEVLPVRQHGSWGAGILTMGIVILIGVSIGATVWATVPDGRGVAQSRTSASIKPQQSPIESQQASVVTVVQGRSEIARQFKTLSDKELQAQLETILVKPNFWYSNKYEPCLLEIVSRSEAESDWEPFLLAQLAKLNETMFVSNPDSPEHTQAGNLQNVELVTALRRVQGKPDPLEIIVEPFGGGELTPLSLPKIKVAICNRDDQDVGIQVGGNYRSGRQTRWHIEMTDQQNVVTPTLARLGVGGGLSVRQILKPGERWETELIVSHMVELDEPGRYQFVVQYSNEHSILNEANLAGFICSRSLPIEIDIKPISVQLNSIQNPEIDRLIDQIDAQQTPHLLLGRYGRWAHDFLDPASPQARLIQIGVPAIPELIDRLTKSTSEKLRAHYISMLTSITGIMDPRFTRAIGEYKFLVDGWGMKNSVQVQQHSGRMDSRGIDPSVQSDLANRWARWGQRFIVVDAANIAQQSVEASEIHGRVINVMVNGNAVEAAVSPNQKRIVFARIGRRHQEIFVADIDGTNPIQLTKNQWIDYAPSWSIDGKRIVFCSTRSGMHQIYEMDADGKNVRQWTREKLGARHPHYSMDGWLGYQVMHKRDGKSQPSDLVISKGDQRIVVAKRLDITDYRWSFDGKTICIGSTNALQFFDLNTQQLTSHSVYEKDERLYAHGPYEINWSPDNQRIACRIKFLGGRMVLAGEKMDAIYGDTELFLISKTGDFEAIPEAEIGNRTEAWIKSRFSVQAPPLERRNTPPAPVIPLDFRKRDKSVP